MNEALKKRSQDVCELCNTETALHEYTVSPKSDESINNQVVLCANCLSKLDDQHAGFYWRCVEGSIWSAEPSVQALSYRIAYHFKNEEWASNLLSSIDLDENVIQWAMSAFEKVKVHTDAFGNMLSNGDNVVLTQALDVKGTNFTASKGTVVKKIKLVQDNHEQVEGRINEQTIVILTKFVKKG